MALFSGLSVCVCLGKDYDLVIYGGTPAGIMAGIAAAREGATVMIVEPTRWIGGMVAGGLTRTDIGRETTIGGFTREFFSRAAAAKPNTPRWYAEPHLNLATFEAMLREAAPGKIEVVKGQRLKSVARNRQRIASITTEDGTTYAGRIFVDATYEGDLLARAGVSYIVGREGRDQYDEPLAGYYPMPVRAHDDATMASDCRCVGGTGPHYIHGTPAKISARDSAGQLLFGVNLPKGTPGGADKLTQAYNFRLCVTKQTDNRVPFPKPQRYDPSRYELLLRLIQHYPVVRFGRLVHLGTVAHDKFDLNAQGLFSTDYAGGNVDYPDGDYATRDRIWQDHVDYMQGYLWFLGHDQRVPQALRDEVNEWGLCKDEFADNAHWPYALYVREARRMIGEYVMRQSDLQSDIFKPDAVAMGSFVIDCHIVQRIVTDDGTVTDEGSFQDTPARPYQIPYRSVTPKKAECENLLVPVCLSASHIAYGSLRMEPVYMALGHASGLAAVAAHRTGRAVQDIDVAALRTKLRAQQQVFELPGLADAPISTRLPGLVVDERDAQFTGVWQGSNYGNPVDGLARHDLDAGKGGKSARFTMKVPIAGRYEVRFAYPSAPNRASNVPVTIEHADGTATMRVNQRQAPNLDQTFVSLGEFRFTVEQPAVVIISNAGTDGYVAVDAVQWLPVK